VAVAALTYESGIAIGVVVAAVTIWRTTTGRRRMLALATGAVALGLLASWIYLTSPKPRGTPDRASALPTALPSLLGAGLLPAALRALSPLVMLAVLAATVAAVLPAFRRRVPATMLAAGSALTALGAAPLLAIGIGLSTDGPFDRANAFALLGVALLLAGTCEWLAGLSPPLSLAVGGLALVVVAGANVQDLDDVVGTQAESRGTLAALADLDPGPGTVLIQRSGRNGWYPFGYGSLREAYRMHTGVDRDLRDPLTERDLAGDPGPRFSLSDGTLVPIVP
jgi:hypothetical protein